MTRIVRLGLALASLTLGAGCLAGPVAAPSVAWLAGGQTVSAGVLGQPDLLAAPAAVATSVAAASRPAIHTSLPSTAAPTEPAPTAAPLEQLPLAALPLAVSPLAVQPSATQPQADEPAARVPILEYHYSSFEMLPTVMMRPAWFQAQLQWLSQAGFHTLTSEELAGFVARRQAAPARSVALTFDVGASHFDEYVQDVVPALRRNHLRAIFFVMPSQTREVCDGKTACWPSLLAWRDEGLISIESHSFTHQDYATLSPEMLAYDIARSKAAIEAKTGQPVLGLCYPFDSVTPAAFDLLAKAGYRFAVAGATRHDRSAEWNDPQPYALPRYYPYSGQAMYPLIGGTGGQTFEQMMLGAVIGN
jgi:peptidoglycan/xylan/chitin deacetylase (PgdA/CDA1 family)